jgi:hypothetical protein
LTTAIFPVDSGRPRVIHLLRACANRVDDPEISMFSLHLLQLSLVYVNTLMI